MRGVEVDHVTVYRWVLRVTALLADAAKPCRHAVGRRWQVDETYVKVAGQWRYGVSGVRYGTDSPTGDVDDTPNATLQPDGSLVLR